MAPSISIEAQARDDRYGMSGAVPQGVQIAPLTPFKPSAFTSVDHLVSSRSISTAYSSAVDANGSAPIVAKRA
jgi:hypothetical protein